MDEKPNQAAPMGLALQIENPVFVTPDVTPSTFSSAHQLLIISDKSLILKMERVKGIARLTRFQPCDLCFRRAGRVTARCDASLHSEISAIDRIEDSAIPSFESWRPTA